MNEEARLEEQLMALARASGYPPTPDLAAGFWRRLEADRARKAPATPLSLATVAIAALVVAFAVIIGTVTPARDAAADLFDRINIFETDEDLSTLPTDVPGEEVSLEEAQAALGEPIHLPTKPEDLTLERVLLQDLGQVHAAALFYRTGDGERFVFFATDANIGKGLPRAGDSSSEPTLIPEKEVGFWLEGRHVVQYYDERGNVVAGSSRVTDANTLVWPEDGLQYRIEGELTREEAVAIAGSVE